MKTIRMTPIGCYVGPALLANIVAAQKKLARSFLGTLRRVLWVGSDAILDGREQDGPSPNRPGEEDTRVTWLAHDFDVEIPPLWRVIDEATGNFVEVSVEPSGIEDDAEDE
jgi:hypothetical protein